MITDASIRARLLSAFPFLGARQDTLPPQMMQAAQVVQLPAGHALCHEGDRCSMLPLVLAGSARVFKGSDTGREITLYRVIPGESCILTASCILSSRPFPAAAVCETGVEAVVVPASGVVAWLQESAAWREFLFGLVADRLARIISVIEDVAFLRMDQRLADYLLQQAPDPDNGWIHTTHQQIADDLGTSREVVSRLLRDLEQRGLVEGVRGRLRPLDRPGLRRAAGAR